MKSVCVVRRNGNEAEVFKSNRLECYLVQWFNETESGVDGFEWDTSTDSALDKALAFARLKVEKRA